MEMKKSQQVAVKKRTISGQVSRAESSIVLWYAVFALGMLSIDVWMRIGLLRLAVVGEGIIV